MGGFAESLETRRGVSDRPSDRVREFERRAHRVADDFRDIIRVLEAKLADVELLDLRPDQLNGVVGAVDRRHDGVPEDDLFDEHFAGLLLLFAGGSVGFGGGGRAGEASSARRHCGRELFCAAKCRGGGWWGEVVGGVK